jgi:hypothetical protein
LEEQLNSFPASAQTVSTRTTEDMIAEILEFTRSETNRRMVTYTTLASPVNYFSPSGGMVSQGMVSALEPKNFILGNDSEHLKLVKGSYESILPIIPVGQERVPEKAKARKTKKPR